MRWFLRKAPGREVFMSCGNGELALSRYTYPPQRTVAVRTPACPQPQLEGASPRQDDP